MQMRDPNQRAVITMRDIRRTFNYNNVPVLQLTIHYPEIGLQNNAMTQTRINARIRAQVSEYYRTTSTSLYRQAVNDYRSALQNGYPFHTYEAVLNYEITYNENCHLSMYRDRYEFTGGAHGNTLRFSDTFDLKSGRTLPLSSYFQPYQNYQRILLAQILRQADANMRQDPIYFDNYPALIMQNFREENYYLTPEGVAIYFQQYEIAPYATGIVVFTVPYSVLHWYPTCLHGVPRRRPGTISS